MDWLRIHSPSAPDTATIIIVYGDRRRISLQLVQRFCRADTHTRTSHMSDPRTRLQVEDCRLQILRFRLGRQWPDTVFGRKLYFIALKDLPDPHPPSSFPHRPLNLSFVSSHSFMCCSISIRSITQQQQRQQQQRRRLFRLQNNNLFPSEPFAVRIKISPTKHVAKHSPPFFYGFPFLPSLFHGCRLLRSPLGNEFAAKITRRRQPTPST